MLNPLILDKKIVSKKVYLSKDFCEVYPYIYLDIKYKYRLIQTMR